VEVFLRTADTVLAQQHLDLRQTLNAEQVILGLTRDFSLDFLATAFQTHTRMVYLSPPELPQHWSGFDSVSALVVKGISLQALTEEQTTALRQWLARGGVLIVAGDSQHALLEEPRVRALLPVQVLGLQQLEGLSAFAEHYGVPLPTMPLMVVRARLTSGQVLVGTADAPLLAQRPFGKGRVVFLAVDYATRPLAGWQGNTALWKEMLQPAESIDFGRVFAELGLLDETHPVIKVLGRPMLAYPSHLALSLFLITYCSTLGLLFWRLGKRQVRHRRYWVGVILVVLGFTGWAYGVFAERGLRQPALLFDMTTMEVLSDTGYTHSHGHLGVFSAPGGQFALTLQQPETILRHTFTRGAGKAGKDLEVTTAETLMLRHITLEPWVLRVFSVESLAATPLRVTARRHASGLTIQLGNQGTLPLQGATVIYQGKLFALGLVAPGEEIFDDLYTSLQAPEGTQEMAWRALFKHRPGATEARLAYLQEVLLQQYFGEKRLADVSDTPLLTGWFMAPTTLLQAPGGLPVWGMTFVVSRFVL
jgi:hypothetical protein